MVDSSGGVPLRERRFLIAERRNRQCAHAFRVPKLACGVITALAGATRRPVIASGLVDALDDLSRLRYVPDIAGAIVGRALMRKAFTLEEALEVTKPGYEEVAGVQ